MAEFPYAYVLGKLKEFLAKIREIGIPNKATVKWLESLGYKSSNDRSMLSVLQQIGFIDETGVSLERWTKYRGARYRKVLAEGIIEGYGELYSMYPDAHSRTTEELESFFSTRSTAGKQVIQKTVSTYKVLCELADFDSISTPTDKPPASKKTESIVELPVKQTDQIVSASPRSFVPKLHIDIQIHISPDASPEQIDQIFASMAKHLYNKND